MSECQFSPPVNMKAHWSPTQNLIKIHTLSGFARDQDGASQACINQVSTVLPFRGLENNSICQICSAELFDECHTKIDLFEVKKNWQIFGLQSCVEYVLFKVLSYIWYQNNKKFEHLS